MFSAQNQMKRVWDEKLGPSRHLKREADIPLSHHNWLTGGPGSGGGEVLQKSMFPESSVKGEYMFLDFINKYFIHLSMACMWWKRALSCHSGFWMGRWYMCEKIEATKGNQQEWARKDFHLNDRQRVELCFFLSADMIAEGVQQNWSDVWQQLVVSHDRQAHIQQKTAPSKLQTRLQHLMQESKHTYSGLIRNTNIVHLYNMNLSVKICQENIVIALHAVGMQDMFISSRYDFTFL